jgi:hypothetical protein
MFAARVERTVSSSSAGLEGWKRRHRQDIFAEEVQEGRRKE